MSRRITRSRSRLRSLIVVPLLALLPLAACSSDGDELTIVAAASLTETFQALAEEFEDEHGVEVTLTFGSSTALAEQAIGGAPGDILATADEESMRTAEDGGALASDPIQFATNRLVLIVPADNPAGITGLDDLDRGEWVRCDDEVPCGRVALALLEENDVTATPSSLEIDVKATLAKVVDGEADAGLVYATDAASAGDAVRVLEISGAEDRLNPYFIARLDQDDSDGLAEKWIEFLNSDAAIRILDEAGFGRP